MFLFIDNASTLVIVLKYILFCYAPFSYTKVNLYLDEGIYINHCI
jgi:hypothetical protein